MFLKPNQRNRVHLLGKKNWDRFVELLIWPVVILLLKVNLLLHCIVPLHYIIVRLNVELTQMAISIFRYMMMKHNLISSRKFFKKML